MKQYGRRICSKNANSRLDSVVVVPIVIVIVSVMAVVICGWNTTSCIWINNVQSSVGVYYPPANRCRRCCIDWSLFVAVKRRIWITVEGSQFVRQFDFATPSTSFASSPSLLSVFNVDRIQRILLDEKRMSDQRRNCRISQAHR